LLIVQIVRVVGGLGLSMAGAMCRTLVAALLTMSNAAVFGSPGYFALIVLVSRLCSRQRSTAKRSNSAAKSRQSHRAS
jgi:hypothetical protein